MADQKSKEPPTPEQVGELAMELFNWGSIVIPCGRYGNVFRLVPPLTMSRAFARKATEIMIDVLKGK